jgi:hypothetical protein
MNAEGRGQGAEERKQRAEGRGQRAEKSITWKERVGSMLNAELSVTSTRKRRIAACMFYVCVCIGLCVY